MLELELNSPRSMQHALRAEKADRQIKARST